MRRYVSARCGCRGLARWRAGLLRPHQRRVWHTRPMRFETTLLLVGNNTGIDVPPAVLDELGGGKRPLVNVTVNDSYSYRSAVAPMGGRYLIAFSSDKRAATGLKGGETDHRRADPRHRAAHGRGSRRPRGGPRRGRTARGVRPDLAEPAEGARDERRGREGRRDARSPRRRGRRKALVGCRCARGDAPLV